MKIRFCSPVRSHSGYGELGRIVLHQLVSAGHEVAVTAIPTQESRLDFGVLGAQSNALIRSAEAADVNIVSMIPPVFPHFRLPGARNIGYTMFETDGLPADWVEACNGMDAIWVPSEWGREVFLAAGVRVPVHVVGVHAEPMPLPSAPPAGEFRLLSMFQWLPRKNPVGLLRAYCAAFHGRKDTVLVLKVNYGNDVQKGEAVLRNAIASVTGNIGSGGGLPRIELVAGLLSSDGIRQLHAGCHAYVGLAHGEGWGLPAWDTALLGRPVLHTGWSAPNEFVAPHGQVRYGLAPVYGMYPLLPFYDAPMRWAEPHLDDAIDKLRNLHGNYGRWSEQAQAHAMQLQQRYSLAQRLRQTEAALA